MSLKSIVLLALCAVLAGTSGCGGGSGRGAETVTAQQPLAETAPATAPTIRLALFGRLRTCPEDVQQRYGVYIGSEEDAEAIRAFKQRNPNAKVFLYQIAAAASDVEWASIYPSDAIGYPWINENRPGWFLLDARDKRITHLDYPYLYALDPVIEEYQQMWADNAIRRAKSIGADGVKIDGVGHRWDWGLSAAPAKYPTIWDYAEAMGSFVRNVVPKIRAAGLLVIGNGACLPWIEAPWSDWISYFDGREYENEPNYEDELHWQDLLAGFLAYPDMMYIAYLPSPERYPEVFRYKVASFLLWMGSNSYAACPYSTNPLPVHDRLLDIRIGQPTGQCTKVGKTIYRRTFEYGEVILNISGSRSESVEVGPGLRDVSTGPVAAGTVTLAPHQSLIMSKG